MRIDRAAAVGERDVGAGDQTRPFCTSSGRERSSTQQPRWKPARTGLARQIFACPQDALRSWVCISAPHIKPHAGRNDSQSQGVVKAACANQNALATDQIR